MISIAHSIGVETFYYSAEANNFVALEPMIVEEGMPLFTSVFLRNNEIYLIDDLPSLYVAPFAYEVATPEGQEVYGWKDNFVFGDEQLLDSIGEITKLKVEGDYLGVSTSSKLYFFTRDGRYKT